MNVSRPHHRARPRREDRRGQPAGSARQPEGHRGLPREPGMTVQEPGAGPRRSRPTAARRCSRSRTSTPSTARSRRSRASRSGQRGRDRHADRRQRRGQVDDPALDLGHRAAAHGPDRLPGRRDPGPAPATRSREIGIAQSPEGRRIFPRMTVLENLEMGAFTRRDQKTIRADIERVYDALPAAEGARAPEGRARCPAASSRCWPWARAHGPAQAAAARRAVARPGAGDRRPHLRRRARASTRRASPSCSSSRTRTTRSTSPRAATCWRRGTWR